MKLDDSEIARLLQLLHSDLAIRRKMAVDGLAALDEKSDEVIQALETLAAQDPDKYIRQAALRALGRGTPGGEARFSLVEFLSDFPLYTTRREKWIDFTIGFVGWYVSSSVGAVGTSVALILSASADVEKTGEPNDTVRQGNRKTVARIAQRAT